jgi:hypothetical protein
VRAGSRAAQGRGEHGGPLKLTKDGLVAVACAGGARCSAAAEKRKRGRRGPALGFKGEAKLLWPSSSCADSNTLSAARPSAGNGKKDAGGDEAGKLLA